MRFRVARNCGRRLKAGRYSGAYSKLRLAIVRTVQVGIKIGWHFAKYFAVSRRNGVGVKLITPTELPES